MAGGQSSRMGHDKAQLTMGTSTLLGWMQKLVHQAGIAKLYISSPRSMPDTITGCGPLGGIHTALARAMGQCEHMLFVPVDMPRLSPELLAQLARTKAHSGVVRFDNHPLPFRVGVTLANCMHAKLLLEGATHLSVRSFQESIGNTIVCSSTDINPQHFTNINTPKQWQMFMQSVGV